MKMKHIAKLHELKTEIGQTIDWSLKHGKSIEETRKIVTTKFVDSMTSLYKVYPDSFDKLIEYIGYKLTGDESLLTD